MVRRTLFAVVAVSMIALTGCATQIMESYIGQPITEAALDYGPPIAFYDLPDGRRAFQWQITSSGAVPMSSPTTATAYGSGGWATVTATSTTYVPYSQTCNYTLIAVEQGDQWIVQDYRQPTLACL